MSARAYIEPGKIPPAVKELLETLRRGGFAAYPVGGAVRDLLLGKQPHDWDVTTAARPEQAEALLSGCRVIETGVRHGTITVLAGETPVELTTFRGEGSYTDGRHPDAVTFGVGLEEDLSRRDFTIGAMAWNAETGEVIDPFGGQADLKTGSFGRWGNQTAALPRMDCAFCGDCGLPPSWGLRSSRERLPPCAGMPPG